MAQGSRYRRHLTTIRMFRFVAKSPLPAGIMPVGLVYHAVGFAKPVAPWPAGQPRAST